MGKAPYNSRKWCRMVLVPDRLKGQVLICAHVNVFCVFPVEKSSQSRYGRFIPQAQRKKLQVHRLQFECCTIYFTVQVSQRYRTTSAV